MIFMKGYGYLYMSTAKKTTDQCYVKRNENCKAVMHISTSTGEFSHRNTVFDPYDIDLYETCKNEILEKNTTSCTC